MNFKLFHNGKKKLSNKEQALLLIVVSSIPWSNSIKIKLNVKTRSEKIIEDFFKNNNIEFEEYHDNLSNMEGCCLISEFDEIIYKKIEEFNSVLFFSNSQIDRDNDIQINFSNINLFILRKERFSIVNFDKKIDQVLKFNQEKNILINEVQKLINQNANLQNEMNEYKYRYNSLKNHLSYQLGSLLVHETKNIKDIFKTPKNILNIYKKFKKYEKNKYIGNGSSLNIREEDFFLQNFENLINEFLYHPFKQDEKLFIENINFLLGTCSHILFEKDYKKIRELFISIDHLEILKNYVCNNYINFSIDFNFQNFESIFQMIFYYDKTESKKECFNYLVFLNQKNFNLFLDILRVFIVEIKAVFEKNNYWNDFLEKGINISNLICNEDFTNKYIKSPMSLNSICNIDFYNYLKSNSQDFSCLLGLFLYTILNDSYISFNLFKLFFKVRRGGNKSIFINSIRRFTFEISNLKIKDSFNISEVEDLINSELIDEDFIYLSMFGFYPEYIEKMIINKIESTNVSEDIFYYTNSRFGNNNPLFLSINEKLESVGLSPIIGVEDSYNLPSFYSKYSNKNSVKRTEDFGKISVIMTCYNSDIYLLNSAINSILNQSYKNIEIILIDDFSENSLEIKKLLGDYLANEKIKYFRMEKNSGPYLCRNKAIELMTGDYVAFQDDDDISHLDRLYYELYFLRENNLKVVYTSNLRFDVNFKLQTDNFDSIYSTGPVTMLFHKSVLDEIGIFKPFKSRGDIAFRKRCERIYGENKVKQIHIPLYYCLGSKKSLSSSFEFNGNFISLKLIRSIIALEKKPKIINKQVKQDTVFGCMATFPAREETLKETISNILPQIDHLYIYLNNYEKIPNFLKHNKITTILGVNSEGDLRDNGKIYPISELNLKGYCFLFDDDIEYPLNYVNEFICKLNTYNNRAIVGVHGVIFEKPFKNYFENRTVFHFKNENIKDVVVNQLGTGALAFHTSLFKPRLSEYKEKGMADVFFAIAAKNRKIPLICIEHEKNWIKPSTIELEDNTNLYEEFKKNHSLQTTYISQAGSFTEISIEMI